MQRISIVEADPQGADALALLRAAALEARQLYPELFEPGMPWPTNDPTPSRGLYVLAYLDDTPVAMGAHRPLNDRQTELRRTYVATVARRTGLARKVIAWLEQHALEQGFSEVLLETGYKQLAAMRLYEACGYCRVEPFGQYAGDPTSVCYAKLLASERAA